MYLSDDTKVLSFSCGLFPKSIQNPEEPFLFYLSERVEEIRSMGSGSTYPEVSRGKFRELEVISPKHSLVTAFCEQAKDMLKQIGFLKQQNRKLRDGRDLLLPRLMSGEIAV